MDFHLIPVVAFLVIVTVSGVGLIVYPQEGFKHGQKNQTTANTSRAGSGVHDSRKGIPGARGQR